MSRCLYLIFFSIYFSLKTLAPDPNIVAHPITGDNDCHQKEDTLQVPENASIKVAAFLAKLIWRQFLKKLQLIYSNSLLSPITKDGSFFNKLEFHLPKNALVKCCLRNETCKLDRQTYGRRSKSDQNISVKLSAKQKMVA